MDTSQRQTKKILHNMERLMILRDLAMLDSDEEPFFDNLTKLASRVIGVPVSLVSLVAADYQFFKSTEGLPEPWKSDRRTPLSHSFCQHVVTNGEPLIVEDARRHHLVKDNLAIPDLNVIGYLGMPIQTQSGYKLGSFCVIDDQPHKWTAEEIAVMQAFTDLVNAEVDARANALSENRLDRHITASQGDVLHLLEDVDQHTPKAIVIEKLENMRAKVASPAQIETGNV